MSTLFAMRAGLSQSNGIPTFTLKDGLSVGGFMASLQAYVDGSDSSDVGELFWELSKKMRVHASVCQEAIDIGLIDFLCSNFFGVAAANRLITRGGTAIAGAQWSEVDASSFEMYVGVEGSLSVFFEMCRYRGGCTAVAGALANGSLLEELVRLARALASGLPRLPPSFEDQVASQPGWCHSRSSLEQALLDTLGRALAGLSKGALRKRYASAIVNSELGPGRLPYTWQAYRTVETAGVEPGYYGEKRRLLTRLLDVPATKWTDLAASSERLATWLKAAARDAETDPVGQPWRPRYVMERDSYQTCGADTLVKALSAGIAKQTPESLAELLSHETTPLPGVAGFSEDGLSPEVLSDFIERMRIQSARSEEVTPGRRSGRQMCNSCGKEAIDGSFKRCSQCRNALYCSVACQRNDWATHKASCIPVRLSKGHATAGGAQCGGH